MPQLSATLSPTGPMLDVLVGVSAPRQVALKAAGQPVPASVNARILIDTGASGTCLDDSIVQALGLSPTSFQPAHTPSTGAVPLLMPQYDVMLVIPHNAISRTWHALPVMAANFKAQGIDGLLGRDIIAHCLFMFNGPDKNYVLAF